jgi:hypothetical protein
VSIYFILTSQGCILGDELIQSNHVHCASPSCIRKCGQSCIPK